MKKLALLVLTISLVLSTVSSATMLREVWWQSAGIDDAVALATGGTPPDQVDVLADSAWAEIGDNYVAKLSGYVIVPADGDYTFYVSSDDYSRLFVSQDLDAANAVQVAFVDGWTGGQVWDSYESQKAEPMTLAAGQIMAVYAVMQEGTGGDNLGIGWTGPGIDTVSLLGANVTHLAYKAGVIAPADGATGVVDVVGEWMAPPLVEAPVYNVYGGTDPEAMDLLAEGITETTLAIGSVGVDLDFLTTYYWRVDVVGQEAGDVWSFTTQTGMPVIANITGDAVLPGGDAQLVVEASDVMGSELIYQWYRSEVNMMGFILKDVPLPEGVAAVLNVTGATIDDEGQYYCTVTNDMGSTTSDLVWLDVQVGLIHRWTFNDSPDGVIVPDVVGGADGTFHNITGNGAIVDGQVVFGNDGSQMSNGGENNTAAGDYVDLPNGLISKLTQLTIECWTTWTHESPNAWQRLFDLGTSDCGEESSCGAAGQTYMQFCPKDGGTSVQFEYRIMGAASAIVPGGTLPLNQETLVTCIHDDVAGKSKLFIDGQIMGAMNAPGKLSVFTDNNMWIGRSQWGDPLYVGKVNEFRMYDTALSAEQVALDYLAGPDDLGVLPEPCDAPIVGDKNGDCVVDFVDIAISADQWLMELQAAQAAAAN
jgi:hypothetical protein